MIVGINLIMMPDIHIIPLNDLQYHIESRQCWCNPIEYPEQSGVIIHNAADGRELDEDSACH